MMIVTPLVTHCDIGDNKNVHREKIHMDPDTVILRDHKCDPQV